MPELQEVGLSSSLELPTAKVYRLSQEQIEHYWVNIEECLREDPTLWAPYFTIEGLHARAKGEHLQVWVICPEGAEGAIKVVFFTHIIQSEVGKDLQIFWMWGVGALKARSCISDALDRFAEHCGCRDITVIGRPGWIKVLEKMGAVFEAVLVRRPIRQGKDF